MRSFKVITFCLGLSMTVVLMIASVEVDVLSDHLPLSMLPAYAMLALTLWPVARHSERFPLPSHLRRLAYGLWLLSIILILVLFWVTPATFIVLMLAYGTAFLLFVVAVIRYYRKTRAGLGNHAE